MTIPEVQSRLKAARYGRQKLMAQHRIAVYSRRSGADVLREIQRLFAKNKAVYKPSPVKGSAAGIVAIGDIQILCKPLGKTGLKLKAGKSNEVMLVSGVKEVLDEVGEPITVKFIDKQGKIFCIPEIISVINTAHDIVNAKKADVVLLSKNGTRVPVSIKKDNAEFWGSAGHWSKKAATWLKKLEADKKIKLIDRGTYWEVEPKFAVKANYQEVENVVFGSDLKGSGLVVERSFADGDFELDNETNELTIKVSKIFRTPNDVQGKHSVWFLVLNEKARQTEGLPKGLRVLAAYEQRVTSTTLRVQ